MQPLVQKSPPLSVPGTWPVGPALQTFPSTVRLQTSHFLTGAEISRNELLALLELAELLKERRVQNRALSFLHGQQIALYFEKPSLRTRVSFAVGIQELGAHSLEILASQTKREEPRDFARVMGGYVHAIVARTLSHRTLEEMAERSSVPIINGLSDLHHPCQALADLLTLKESFGGLEGLEVAYIGDGNNVLHSLLTLGAKVGLKIRYACPPGYGPHKALVAQARFQARENGGSLQACSSPRAAAAGAQALYTDVWTSMGFEDQSTTRMQLFQSYQVNEALLALADHQAVVMHCLPMNRGQEIAQNLPEAPASVIFRQSENRLHVQKALLLGLLPRLAA